MFVTDYIFQAQSENDSPVTTAPDDEITKIQEKGLAILEIRILMLNLPEDLLVIYPINQTINLLK